jgi:hypothetical protein
METTLDQMRRLLSQPDGSELRSWSGTGRGYRILFAGCTRKVSLMAGSRKERATLTLASTESRRAA